MSEAFNFDNAEGWRPEAGAVLVGTVTAVDKAWSDYMRGYYPIITVQPDRGNPVAVHCFHTSLFNRMRELKPQHGERIGIKYKGEAPLKSNPSQTVHVYVVRIDGRDADIWADIEAPARAVPVAIPPRPASTPASGPAADDDIPF